MDFHARMTTQVTCPVIQIVHGNKKDIGLLNWHIYLPMCIVDERQAKRYQEQDNFHKMQISHGSLLGIYSQRPGHLGQNAVA
jgi:hypothetical protein